MKKVPILSKLYITNTLTSKKELFQYGDSDDIKMYVCGITPYDYAHIGHGRCYVTFDFFYRLLKFLGYEVLYCRNFTDIDDKLINKAAHLYNDQTQFNKIAEFFISAYQEDMKALNCLNPNFEPKVTENMDTIIDFIQGLINNGKAYVVGGDVYYSISNFNKYGALSKRNLDDLCAGARVDIRDDKKNPLDFALWKSAQLKPYWQSPWGNGRPGWHIECSAMAYKYLGKSIDIHGGGMDLIFPHHENEIAQSEGLFNNTFARFWLHNAFVLTNKEKMSKSLGNFVTLRDICNKFNPMVIRYYYLIHHYRSPLDFSPSDIESSAKSYQRLCKLLESIEIKKPELTDNLILSLLDALCDDLNVAKFFGIIFDYLKTETDRSTLSQIKWLLVEILGLLMEPLPEENVVITPEILAILKAREQARAEKNWALADKYRDQLTAMGYLVQDKKT